MVVGKQPNHKDHDIALTQLLKTARECNVHLNYDKLQYKRTEVNFFGKTYTIDGQKPLQSKVKVIQDMPPPQSKKQVQSFIGMINYLSKFSACLSELAEPICNLGKERVPFNWGLEHNEAFSLIKKEVTAAPILAYYNPKKLMVLQTDASCKGLGACLLQNEKLVYFASKALTETQKGYMAIELESLVVAWAMEKFHHFLYGNQFTLETDQKPLEAILSKSLNQATPRLQRILIRTFLYNFKIRYIPGSTNQIADCLSRLGVQKDSISLPKLQVNQITSQLKARDDSLHRIRQATQADDNLTILKHIIQHRWPRTVKEVPQEIQKYWTFHEELTIEDGLILKGMQIVIPEKMREDILKQIHEGHLGFNKCQMRVKETVYWPGLNDQLENLILNCQLCLKYSKSKNKSTPLTALGHEVPAVPWSKVATDIFHYESQLYLLVVDYTSRFPIVRRLNSMSAQCVTEHFKSIFSEYGWPDTLVSDNGPCYTAEMFTNLMKEYAVNHIMSSPHYPQSNGLAEKFVQIVKNLFYKANEEGVDINKYLMIYHNTPLACTSKSPMQMLQQRSARSQLPMSNAARRRLGIGAKQPPKENQHLPSHDFHIGQDVMCQSPITKKWFPVKIKELCLEPRSYQVEMPEGIVYRRTQNHLKPFTPSQRTQTSEQYSKLPPNRTLIKSDYTKIQQ